MSNTDSRPTFKNLVQVLSASVERFRDRPLFGDLVGEELKWTSYGEFAALVDTMRTALAKHGLKAGETVGIIANNRLEWAVIAHATVGLGARYVPMYEQQSSEDWQFILNDSEAVLCFAANEDIARRVGALQSQLPKLREVFTIDGASGQSGTYASLMASGKGDSVPARMPADDELAVLIYTSGTTGKPKGVMLSHYNIASNVTSLMEWAEVGDGDRGLAFLPWAHIFGGSIELNLTISTGSSTVICGDAMQLQHYLPRVQPTVLFAVPRVWNKIYDGIQKLMAGQAVFQDAMSARRKQRRNEEPTPAELEALDNAQQNIFPLIRNAFGGKLRYACSGAAALAPEVGEFMDTLGIEVLEGYGMTETGGVMTSQPPGAVRLGSVGKPLPGVRIELDKAIESADPNEGEIIVYGDAIMRGYYKLEQATEQVITADGGLRTGDIGRIDADGYLYLTGRVKELYKLENGKYVAPVPLEEQLSLSPYVAQAVVFGSGHAHNVALIIPDLTAIGSWAGQNGVTAEGEALLSEPKVISLLASEIDEANAKFKGYERVRGFAVEPEALSPDNGMLTLTMKLKRKNFQEKYAPAMQALYKQLAASPENRALLVKDVLAKD